MPRLESSPDLARGKRASNSNNDDIWANSSEASTKPQQELKVAPPEGSTSSTPNESDDALKAPHIPQRGGSSLSGSQGGSNLTAQSLTVSLDSAKSTRLTKPRPKFNRKAKSANEKRRKASRSEEPDDSSKPASVDSAVGESRSGYVGRLALSSDAPELLIDDAAAHHVTATVTSSRQADHSIGLLHGGNALPVGDSEKNPLISRCKQLCVSSAPATVTNGGVAPPFPVQSSGREPLTSSACPALSTELLPSTGTGSFARVFSSLLRVDRRAAASVLTYQLTFLALVVASSVLILRSPPRKRYAAPNGSEWNALAVLADFVNVRTDPCGSFYHYVCGSASRGSHSAWSVHNMLKPWWARIGSLYWPSSTKAGKFLRDYFQACIDTSMEIETRGAETARALVEIVKPRATMTWSGFLVLLMDMNLKYGVKAVVVFSMLGSGPWPHAIIPVTPKVRAEDPLAVLLNPVHHVVGAEVGDVYDRVRRDALSTLNQALSTNVTGRDVERLVADLDSAAAEPLLGGVGHLDVLETAVPAMKRYKWRLYIEDIVERPFTGRVYHAPIPALKHRFSILLDEKRLLQAIVFALLEATTDLLLDIIDQLSANNTNRYFLVCQKLTFRFEAVAVLSAIQKQPRGPQHDSALVALFESVTEAVVSQVSRSFATSADASKAASRLRELRLLMPSEVIPLDTPLPTLSASYARNYLLAETYGLSVDRFQPEKEDLDASAVTALLGRRPSVIGVYVLLPVTLCVALKLASYTEAVVPMSVVGVDMADALWFFAFQGSWSQETLSTLSEYARCRDAQQSLSRLRFQYPVLSLGSVLSASRNALWNHKFTVDELSFETSRSEVFYTLFVMHHYCLSSRKTRAILAAEVEYLTGVSVDFAKAFGCLLPKHVTACALPGLQ